MTLSTEYEAFFRSCSVHHSYKRDGQKVQIFAADQRVLSKAMFKIVTPEVDKYLLREPENSEPYTLNNGSTHIGRVIRTIQELMRLAIRVFHHLDSPRSIFSSVGVIFSFGQSIKSI